MKLSWSVLILLGLTLKITMPASGQISATGTVVSVPAATNSDNLIATNPAPDIRVLAQRAEQIRTVCVQNRRRVCGQVIQIAPGGLVVESGYTDLLRPELARSWVAPGTVSANRPANLIEEQTPGAPCVGLVFLTDIPKRPAVKLYDYVIIEAYPAGEYAYEPVPNVTKTIRRFSALLEGAVQWQLTNGEK